MITIRRAQDRGHAEHGWLDTYHTFSFAHYYDPQHENFRALRVMNEDRVAPGKGFGMHSHNDMEIITIVLEGALEHKDSLGNGEVLRPGEVQRMSAGSGIRHSEFNPSTTEPVHLYQIWLLPARENMVPSYEQKAFDERKYSNKFQLIASPTGSGGSLTVHQDASLYRARVATGFRLACALEKNRAGWLQVLRGNVELNGTSLAEGDGAAIADETTLEIMGLSDADVVLFDLA